MNAATCAVLAGVFPLILIAVVADRRTLHIKLKTTRWYRASFVGTIGACIMGLAYAVVGVQTGGYDAPAGSALWVLGAFALLVFTLSLIMNTASMEGEEDESLAETKASKVLQVF